MLSLQRFGFLATHGYGEVSRPGFDRWLVLQRKALNYKITAAKPNVP